MPNDEQELIDFINSRDVVDIIIRKSKAFSDYISDKPYIKLGGTLIGDYQLVYIPRDLFNQVRNDLGGDIFSGYSVLLTLMGRESLEDSKIINVQNQPYLNLRGTGVLIGFVDTGIDYTLPAFRYEDGTSKIRYIWDQTIPGNYPYEYYVGTEYTREEINNALRSSEPFSVVPHKDTVGHGTFLAAQASSRTNDNYIGAAPDSELIVVKLKKARNYYLEDNLVPPDQENVFESSGLMAGVDYIYRRAQELEMPVVICVGLGTNMGGHDGFSILGEYLSGISHRSGVCLCTAAGNESQARHHTQGIIPKEGTEDIEVRVGEDGESMRIDVWNYASDRISVSVKSPAGEIINRVPARSDTKYETKLILEKARVMVEYYFPVEAGGGQVTRIKIADCTPGVWTLTLHGDIILDGTYHAWLPVTGLGSPHVEFLTPVPNVTIVIPGTTIGAITVGAYNNFVGSLYSESSWGPTRLPAMSPDFVSPGVDVSGIYPGGKTGTMSGTSVATAITSGACALMMQWGVVYKNDLSINTYRIKAFLIRSCVRDQNIEYPNYQWGYGKLDLYGAFRLML